MPCKGIVGASGDLAPLSHLILGLMGEGLALDANGVYVTAATMIIKLGIEPLVLMEKEGLALNLLLAMLSLHFMMLKS